MLFRSDVTAFVLVFPPITDEDKYIVLPFFWIPEDTIELRVRRDHVPYDVWQARGQVITTEGNVIHYGYIENFIEDLGTKYNIKLMKLVLEQKIAHGGNVPLRWMMDNVFVRTDPAGNVKMDKEKSTERIDGAVALVMALDRAIRNKGTSDSVYNDRGIIII